MFRSVLKLARVASKSAPAAQQSFAKLAGVQTQSVALRNYSSEVEISEQDRVDQWVKYFEHPETDHYNIRAAYEDMMKEDCFLEPEVIRASLYAARRIHNLPLAMRILEIVKKKCRGSPDVYLWTMQELQPTMTDLGLKTVEEYGLHIVSLD